MLRSSVSPTLTTLRRAPPPGRCHTLFVLLALVLPLFLRPSLAQAQQDELKGLSIEQLMRIDVTTAGRRAQPVGTTPAAISVITGDDIRRAGATTLAEALRLADGVHVARFNNGTWRISPRGFNGTTPNKLLVMVDGRTVYSPLFAGAFWNTLDYLLEDIDRIEVIRGPGTVLWGANAVNGVINIITRHSRDTQGGLMSVSAGNEDPIVAQARYGGRAAAAAWRVYGKLALRDAQKFASGASTDDSIRRGQAGFRVDSTAAGAAWLVKGDAFHSRDDLPDRDAGEFTDLALQARWSRVFANSSRVDAQTYYRREYRRVPSQLTHHIDVVDLDLQHATRWGTRHDIVWGGGTRINSDETAGSASVQFDPVGRTYGIHSLFAQDEIAVVPGRLFAVLGIKYEHNAFSGGELQPNVRARLAMARNQIVWAGISRAVRRPTRIDDDLVALGPTGTVLIRGTHEFQAEKLTAFETGYRVQPVEILSFEATGFWHDYDDLRSQDAPVSGIFPLTIGNTLQGRSRGIELGINLQPLTAWRTHVGYTFLDTRVDRQPGSRDTTGGAAETNDPNHLFALRSSFDLPRRIELDFMLRAVGALPAPEVPAYAELTARAGWQATPRLEVFVVGDDLLHSRHPENGPPTPARVEFERALRAGLTVRF